MKIFKIFLILICAVCSLEESFAQVDKPNLLKYNLSGLAVKYHAV